MSTLADVFRELNTLVAESVIRDYALGGATAVLFYAEPSRTYDVDVFVVLSSGTSVTLDPLRELYDWARRRGFGQESEHVLIHGVPVQFLPAHNTLAEDAVASAVTHEYEGVPVRVMDPETASAIPAQSVDSKKHWRHAQQSLPLREKVRILLELQRQELPLIQKQRPLRSWERPWPIDP